MNPENAEFLKLAGASGWKDAQIARTLGLSPSSVSQYRSGGIAPSEQVLRLFKMVLANEKPAALAAIGGTTYPEHRDEFHDLRDQLEELKKNDPDSFRSAKLVIGSLHEQAAAKARRVELGARLGPLQDAPTRQPETAKAEPKPKRKPLAKPLPPSN